MNELDLIRAFREDVPAPSPGARQRALHELRSAPGAPRRTRARVALPIAGAAAAAAVTTVLLLGSSGDDLTPEASAAERLRQVAAVAESAPDPRAVGPGQFWYQRSIEAHLTTAADGRPFSVIQPHVREQWIGRDGGGRVRTTDRGEPRFPGPRDRQRWRAAGSPALGGELDVPLVNEDAGGTAPGFYIGSQRSSYDDLRALPADVDALYTRLRRAAGDGSGVDQRLFVLVGDLLRSAPLSSEVRGALYRVAARIPGIHVVDRARDAAGRPGVGIARDAGDVRSVLIYDPETGELLGEQSILLERRDYVDAAPGAVIGEAAYLEAGTVDSTGARP